MESKLFFLIILSGCIVLFLGVVVSVILVLMEKKQDWIDYDNYILSILWSPSFCFNQEQNQSECFDRLDELNINKSFIIHGLWPAYSSGDKMDYCNQDDKIEVKFNKAKENSLSKIWPGLWSSNYDMWNNEYNEHGYCYIKRLRKDVEKDYERYFNITIEKFGQLGELLEYLFPDTPQGLHTISSSKLKEIIFESEFKLQPSTYSFQCIKNEINNTLVLSEIWLNYDTKFNPTNIPKYDNCTERFDIYFRDDNKTSVWEKYDFYIMTIAWGPTFCKVQGEECYKRLREKSELNIFTIHGLWPAYKSGITPQWCNLDTNIEVVNFTKDMEDYWINIYKKDNKEFWEYEYNKHGFCYNKRSNISTNNYTAYFNKAMDIYKNTEFKGLMQELYPEFVPGENLLTQKLLEKNLSQKYGNRSFTFTCLNYQDKYYLKEIRFKYDLKFHRIVEGNSGNNCPSIFYVELLEEETPQIKSKNFYKEYDMYFFSISWLGTTYHLKGPQCYERVKSGAKNEFVINGLWPHLRNGSITKYWCNGRNDIEIDIKNKELLNFMNKYWISGYHTNEYFWGHEYNKHGYCYNQRKGYDVNDYEKYFQKSKEMFINNKFDNLFLDFFKKEQIEIKPGDMAINRTKFETYFEERGFGKDYYLIVCTNITNNSTKVNPHISEIRIRYDLDFKLLKNETDTSEFDCPEIFYAQFL